MAVNDFDLVAPFYDLLGRIVFGKSLVRAQLAQINEITPGSSVLILGGGTGEMLTHMGESRIVFVEQSKNMIQRAEQRPTVATVRFVNIDFLYFQARSKFDYIVCPFFLDCFDTASLTQVVRKCKSMLASSGRLIVADFEYQRVNSFILNAMHAFFSLMANLQSKKLKPLNEIVLSEGFELVEERFLHRNALFSRLYRNL
ncbi:MAG: class I SAM-dependent methyltransferase [Ekhidna sp.]|nr:class I SAM-dependent methyltransferase [Ekhidna sp.]